MLILFPHFNARSETVMSHPSTTDRLAYKGGVSVVFGMGGGSYARPSVVGGKICTSVLFISVIDN
jgi:hypothetical protein